MKKLSLLLMAAISIMAASCGSTDKIEVITVNNADELIKALGNDRTIILNNTEGIYWLTEAIDNAIETSSLLDGWNHMEGKSDIMANRAFDGNELCFYNIKNLTIRGADDGERTKIYVSPRYADVFSFEGCTDITLENLELGHYPEEGSCTGAVLGFSNCDRININNCDLFGCGITGIEAVISKNFKVTNSTIRDCSYSNIWLTECQNFRFYNCDIISENYLTCYDCKDISFEKCKVPTSFDESLSFIDCEFFEWPGFVYPDGE